LLLKEITNDANVKGITCDSRKIKKGFVFVAIKGTQLNGHDFIKDAINNGASYIVSEQEGDRVSFSFLKVKDARAAYVRLCADFYKNPSEKLKVIGITGTNGKTTTTYLVDAILKKAGFKCGKIGTIDYSFGKRKIVASNTTPDAGLMQSLLYDMVEEELNYCIIEVSSHALDQGRTDLIKFHSAVFTNLSKEHLDYHKTMDEYFLCKKKLFDQIKKQGYTIINIDDIYGKKLLKAIAPEATTYGFNKAANVRAENEKLKSKGSEFLLITLKGKIEITTSLIGRYNIYNILAAASVALEEGVGLNVIKEAISEFQAPPGRMELVSLADDEYSVYVDYAHTDDALRKALTCVSELANNKIITVFGCGGDRDKEKRPNMGKTAAEFSDFVIITSDNPRSEDPAGIMEQIKKGLPKNYKDYLAIEDRAQAIEKAIGMAGKDDIVLLAGKGHETYQIFKHERVHFDDREIARAALMVKKQKCLA